jgi:ribonuclease D
VTLPEVSERVGRLKEWRRGRAAELKVEISVVLPQRLIDRLAEKAPRSRAELGEIEGLRQWRIETFGEEILATLAS